MGNTRCYAGLYVNCYLKMIYLRPITITFMTLYIYRREPSYRRLNKLKYRWKNGRTLACVNNIFLVFRSTQPRVFIYMRYDPFALLLSFFWSTSLYGSYSVKIIECYLSLTFLNIYIFIDFTLSRKQTNAHCSRTYWKYFFHFAFPIMFLKR